MTASALRWRTHLGASAALIILAANACTSGTCPSGRTSGTGACIVSNAATADGEDGGETDSAIATDANPQMTANRAQGAQRDWTMSRKPAP